VKTGFLDTILRRVLSEIRALGDDARALLAMPEEERESYSGRVDSHAGIKRILSIAALFAIPVAVAVIGAFIGKAFGDSAAGVVAGLGIGLGISYLLRPVLLCR